jgi:hypothetical protein
MENNNKKDLFKGEQVNVYVRSDIIYATMSDESSEEAVERVIEKIREELIRLDGQGKIFIHINPVLGMPLRNFKFRKKVVYIAKDIVKSIGFKKAAIFGPKISTRTVANFIISAVGVKNVKIFGSKEKALEWLSKDK